MEMDWKLKPGPTGIETEYSPAFVENERKNQEELLSKAIASRYVSMGG